LACIFVAFGAANIVHPLKLHLYASCGKVIFFPCSTSSQDLDEFGARIFGLIAIGLGLFVGWLSWLRK